MFNHRTVKKSLKATGSQQIHAYSALKKTIFLRSPSAATKSYRSDYTEGKPMQMKTRERCVPRGMLYATFFSKLPSSSIFDFSAAMAQIRIPNTALATTSAIE